MNRLDGALAGLALARLTLGSRSGRGNRRRGRGSVSSEPDG